MLTRHLASIPSPIRITVARRWLHDLDPKTSGWEPGRLIALESYEGLPITGMFLSDSGGTFHDLPMEAFEPIEKYGDLQSIPIPLSYSNAARGNLSIECCPHPLGPCLIFDRKKRVAGRGKSVGVAIWPEGNALFHLILAGRWVLLWPPHKLLFGDFGDQEMALAKLPDWKKLHSNSPAYCEAMSDEGWASRRI